MVGTEGSQVAEMIGRRGCWRARSAFDVVGMGGATGATSNGAAVIVTGETLAAKVSPEGRRVEGGAVGVGHDVRAAQVFYRGQTIPRVVPAPQSVFLGFVFKRWTLSIP